LSIPRELGCGSGRDLLWLKNRGFHVIGFERSPGLAELCRMPLEAMLSTLFGIARTNCLRLFRMEKSFVSLFGNSGNTEKSYITGIFFPSLQA